MKTHTTSQQIDAIIATHKGWKRQILSHLRTTIRSASYHITEEVKWKTPSRPEGLPVWSYEGIICFAEIWKDNIKLLFPKGALLEDPDKLFNARLKSKTTRAIELKENDTADNQTLIALVLEAMELNAKN